MLKRRNRYMANRQLSVQKSAFLRLTAFVCVLMMALFALPVTAFAQDDVKTVRVGYYENEVFQEGAGESSVKKGYAYEYYLKLSEYTGWKYEYVYGSYSELYQMLIDGKIDLLAGLAKKQDREQIIGYPESAMGNETYNLVKHNDDSSITTDRSTLSGKRIGVLESALADVLRNFLSANNVEAEVVTFSDYQALFEAFDKKQVDVLAAEGDGAYGRDRAEVLYSFGSSDYYMCVNKNRSDLLEELNEAQTQILAQEPDYLYSLRSKYYPISVSSRAFSAAEKQWLSSHDQLRIGYLNNYLPYSDTDSDGQVTGIIKDLVPKIIESLAITDIKVTYKGFDSYDEMIAEMGKGNIDAAFPVGGGLYYSEENGLYQSNAVVSTTTELVYKDEHSGDTVSEFAVNENNRMQYYYVKTNFPDADIKMYDSIDECLDAVVSGKAKCTTLNGLRANEILKNSKYKSLQLRQLARSDDICFGVEIGNDGLLKLLNRGIAVVGSDYAQSLANRYMGGLYEYTFVDVIRDHMWLFAAIIFVVILLIIFFLVRDSRRSKKEMRDKEQARKELEEKNAELAESQKALSDALVAAEHANRAKTTFLNNMSHDIRTPMNAIVGFTALAASHSDNSEQVRDYLSKISVSSQHLLSLINDVLDMSRIESGKVTIDETNVNLPELIRDIRTIILPNINSKQLELFIDTQDVVNEDIISDKLRLNQILLNILTNAVKFTPSGGTISFRVIEKSCSKKDFTSFEFRIKDNGIGMSDEFRKTIFEAFTREQTATVSGIQGTGLGMAITKNIVDMMGGTITVNSEEGKGSEFIVEIPCRISESPTKFENIPELQGLRALVADDDVNTCLSVCAMLRQIGMRPDWTNYGKEAVIRAKDALESSDEFSAYIIDWMMPDLNGIETVRRIRKIIGDSSPIIILTAYDWSDIEQEAREAGVTAFCSKPLFMSELRQVLTDPLCSGENSSGQNVQADFSGRRVLVAEDIDMNQQIAAMILSGVGFEVEIADDGEAAVEKIENAPSGYYDVVLMDIQMPKMNGYEAAKRIRSLSDKTKAQIPIIAVTANAFEEDKNNALGAGMNGHLAKPYQIPNMMKTLSEILGGDK